MCEPDIWSTAKEGGELVFDVQATSHLKPETSAILLCLATFASGWKRKRYEETATKVSVLDVFKT